MLPGKQTGASHDYPGTIGAVKHLMLGSVVENVVRHAPCTVLVVR